ncbi:MAG: energy-coupling factor transporter transmembrane component T family protein [Faecousia sp.]
MLKDITLGQYFPGNSVIHRLDPRTKLIVLIVYMVTLFIASGWVSYAVMLVFLAAVIKVSTIPLKSIVRGMKPLVMILIFTGVLNLFFTKEGTVIVDFWKITVTTGGVERAAFMVARILMLITGTFLLTYTTSPISLTDGLESLMGPLKAVKVPVHELSMMMCIALRFIPTLIEETDKIMSAQKARGADFESGKLMERAKALIPILVPLFISAFRRADELATAMECRCYQGGEGRTKMKLLHYKRNDFAAFGVAAVLVAAVVTLKNFGL